MTDADNCVPTYAATSILAGIFQSLTGMPTLECECGPDTGQFDYACGDFEDGYSVSVRPRHHPSCPIIEYEERQMSEKDDQLLERVRQPQAPVPDIQRASGEGDEFTILALETLAAIEATIHSDSHRRDEILRGSQFQVFQHANAAFSIAAILVENSSEPEELLSRLRLFFNGRPWSRGGT